MALIKCPECGKMFSEHASKCPQCGMSLTDAIRINRELEAKAQREEEERQRLQRERELKELEEKRRLREAQEAEEARIRAEQRAEWWAANKKKVIITTIVIISIIAAIIGIKKAVVVIAEKKAVTEAYELIEKGNQLIDTYHFDEAKDLFDSALKMTADKGVQDKASWSTKKMFTARQAADIEYDKALKRLRILLDADDNEFNQYSNECLDKMIEIYPERKETKYYKNIRGK